MTRFFRPSASPTFLIRGALSLALCFASLGACSQGGRSDSDGSGCAEGLIDCDGSCVDIDSNAAHCGSCGEQCGDDLVCSGGECQSTCDFGLGRCDSSCPDFNVSAEHCGSCDNACDTRCDEGACEESPGAGGGNGSGGRGGASGGQSGSGGGSTGSGGSSAPPVTKFLGNITTRDQVDTDGLTFSTYWDQITPENAGKWGSVEWSAGSGRNWGTLDSIYAYTEQKGILFKQHAFVWGSQQPSGTPSSDQVRSWIQDFCQRYPNTKLIDVVNEPPPHTEPNYTANLGGGTNGDWAWVTQSFKWAREYCPNSVLILNDYNNIEWETDSDHFISIVKTVLENGAPVDAVGAQSHDLDHQDVSTEKMKTILQKLHDETGLPVYITEYDISDTDDQNQLDLYQQHIPHFMETEWIHGITVWGWIYGTTWDKAPNSGLVRNGSSRPAMSWLMDQYGRPSP